MGQLLAAEAHDELAGVGVTLMSPPEVVGPMARGFEEAGVESLWVGEYFQSPLVRAAVVAGATSRVTIGTHVLQAFARSPLVTALAAEELQELSGGRFVLGLGSQVPAVNRRWHGISSPRPVEMLEEYVSAVRDLLGAPHDQPVRFVGRTWCFDVPGLRPSRTQPPPPIFIGGAGPRTVRAADTVGDGLLGHLLWTPSHVRGVVMPLVAAAQARSKQKADRPFPVTMSRLAAPSTVPGWERDAAERLLHYATTPEYQPLLEIVGVPIDRGALIAALADPDSHDVLDLAGPLIDRFCVSDSTGLRRQLVEARSAGVDAVLLFVPAGPGAGRSRRRGGDALRYETALQQIVHEVVG